MEGLPAWSTIARDFSYFLRTSGRSEGTARTYVANLSLFWRWCLEHELDPRCGDRALVRHWCNERQELVSKARAHNELAAVRAFYEFCKEEGWSQDDPTQGVKVKRARNLPTKPITQEEFEACLEVGQDERDRLILLVMAYTGMRISELSGLRAEDIDWRRGLIKILGKGDKQRLLMPNPEVMGRLHAFVGMFPAGPIWLSRDQGRALSAHQLRKIIYDIGKRAGVPDLHPHRLRAFFAVRHIQQFGDLDALSGVMGHESPDTTARYVHWTRDQRGLDQMRRLA